MTHDVRSGTLSRHALLQRTARAGIGALLAVAEGGSLLTAATARHPRAIQDAEASRPHKAVTVRLIDSGDNKMFFWTWFAKDYHRRYPNRSIAYDALPWTQIAQVIPLAVRNGTAPDVFQVPLAVQPAQAVQQSWVQPWDAYIPGFDAWKRAFPPGSFLPGTTDFGGKTFALPVSSNRVYNTLLHYNPDYLHRAGYDPASHPLTWNEFRLAARKVTQQGGGRYYGLITSGNQPNIWGSFVRNLARMAGASAGGDDIDYKTGAYNYTADAYIAAIELLLALKADGSVFPGIMDLNAPQARAIVPQGTAAMILQGPWTVALWLKQNPHFRFGVAGQPIPDHGRPLPLTVAPGSGNYYWLYAKSENGAVAGDIFHYLGTLSGQKAWAKLDGGGDPPLFAQAAQGDTLPAVVRTAVQLGMDQTRIGPDPVVATLDVVRVIEELKTPEPDFDGVVQGLYTGQLSNPKQQMRATKERYEMALEQAIKAARAKGARVSRDDWKFSNWDPTKNYTADDYRAQSG